MRYDPVPYKYGAESDDAAHDPGSRQPQAMSYVLIALALFWLFKILGVLIEAPDWLWLLSLPGAAALALAPWTQSWIEWFSPFAIAGIVVGFQLVENLLIVKADEALTVVMRATARRPR